MIKLEAADLATRIKEEVKAEITGGIRASLAAVRVGDDPASAVYVKNKIRACEEVGIRSEHHALPESTTTEQLLELIASLNTRDDVDGILTQLPLPAHVDETAIIEAMNPSKDVDGFHPVNAGKLAMGRPVFVPCTPAGIIELLDDRGVEIRGANACVVGRSQIVGRPMAQLLLQRDATVTICQSRTRDLAAVTRTADLLVVAIGRAGFIGRDHIKPGATVIDVGINRIPVEGGKPRLVGDVAFDEAMKVAGAVTPVPGGVGPMTISCLLANTVRAACMQAGFPIPDFSKPSSDERSRD